MRALLIAAMMMPVLSHASEWQVRSNESLYTYDMSCIAVADGGQPAIAADDTELVGRCKEIADKNNAVAYRVIIRSSKTCRENDDNGKFLRMNYRAHCQLLGEK
jgi:hypothetical protein